MATGQTMGRMARVGVLPLDASAGTEMLLRLMRSAPAAVATVCPLDGRRLPEASVDIIVAADVLAYIGDCAELFGEAHRVLRTNGRLVFTLEEGSDGFGLGPGGRFVHSEAYLYEAAAAAGLRVVALDRGPMRSQGGAPVVALIAALGPVS